MLRPLIERPLRSRASRSRERGVTMALVAVAIFSIIAMAGLAVDLGTLYEASAEVQRAADAGALAAARMISMTGVTGDPTNHFSHWQSVCGGASSPASSAAVVVVQQNTVGGSPVPTSGITVTYTTQGGGATNTDCSQLTASFGVNPIVIVKVQQTNLPAYFSRIWGSSGRSVSAMAVAEVFNPSGSGAYSASGNLIPVQPRCVKPWMVANADPVNAGPLVNLTDGSIADPGISVSGSKPGVIGENFTLIPDCPPTGLCNPPTNNPPIAPTTSTLQYLPGCVPGATCNSGATPPVAVPSCANTNPYQQAIAGCDQTTQYQCGVSYSLSSNPNQVDGTENPSGIAGDTSVATQCLLNQSAGTPDQLNNTVYPYQISAGAGNPLNVSGALITSSNSIVTLPIIDNSPPNGNKLVFNAANVANVTVVGFMQVFIQVVDINGNPNVYVLNVAGCGNGQTTPVSSPPIYGTSPVPIRLITPP
jgi:hypothetical protein